MTANPNGRDMSWVATPPPGGCVICKLHRRGTGESDCNGTVGHILIESGGAICGDCAEIIKAAAPA